MIYIILEASCIWDTLPTACGGAKIRVASISSGKRQSYMWQVPVVGIYTMHAAETYLWKLLT